MRKGAERGAATRNGMDMLIGQAEAAGYMDTISGGLRDAMFSIS
ncbi:MAG: hypothetical protein R2795_17505 [Saprospiraceae bacterium]